MKYKSVLLLGGAGFIGSHLAIELSKIMDVVIIDHFSHKEREWFDCQSDNITIYNTSITQLNTVESIIIKHNIDVMIDLVSLVRYNTSVEFGAIIESQNVRQRLTCLSKKHNVHYIYISSLDTVTSSSQRPSDYVTDKKNTENLLIDLSNRRYIDTTIIRLGSVYGYPRFGNYTGAIINFIDAAEKNLPLKIFKGAHHYRNFIFIEDIYIVIFELLAMGRTGGVINLNGMCKIGIHNLAKNIIKMTGSSSKITSIEYNSDTYYEEDINYINHLPVFMDVNYMDDKHFYNNVQKIIDF